MRIEDRIADELAGANPAPPRSSGRVGAIVSIVLVAAVLVSAVAALVAAA